MKVLLDKIKLPKFFVRFVNNKMKYNPLNNTITNVIVPKELNKTDKS